MIVDNSTFSGNSASGNGGGVFISPYCYENCGLMTVTVSNSTFSGNSSSGAGGGIFHDGHYMSQYVTVIVSSSTFLNNTAGAIFSGNHTTLNVSNSTVSGNSGPGIATAIYSYATLSVSNSIFTGNSGHGIRNGKWNSLTVSNSAFSGNGGISYGVEATLTVINSTLHGVPVINSEYDGTLTLKDTIVASSLTGGNCTGAIIDGGGNLSYPDASCPGINANPRLGPLQDNGGSTWTMALGPGSAAIDAADDAICAAPPVNNRDQRGVIRPQDAHCAIGALEQPRRWLPVLMVTTSP